MSGGVSYMEDRGTKRLEVPIDVKVVCRDAECGYSIAAVINPVNDRITHVAVRETENAVVARLVPVDRILSSDAHAIRLSCGREDLKKMPVFSEAEFIPYDLSATLYMQPYAVLAGGVTLEKEHIPAGELSIRRGSTVRASDGYVGTVDEFVVEPERFRITHLILRKGHLWDPKEVTIPADRIDRLEEGEVRLKLTRAEIGALPAVKVARRWL
jgi:hypothetical protein